MQTFLRILTLAIGLIAAAAVAVTAAVIGAYHFAYPGLPPAETIRDIPLQVPLRVYSRDGLLISELGAQRRLPVEYDEIPEVVVQALLAAEDDRFFDHPGVDYQGVLRAAWILLKTGSRSQGGSTITMQLARDYFLGREREFTRKVREIFLAYRIEKQFSKQDILAMFLNKMFFGQRAYGIAAAAQIFYDKRLDELNAAEAATLVGVLAAPSRYNPVSGPEASRSRRGYVLRRMRELDYLSESDYREMMDYPFESELHGPDVELNAPYVAEMVRREMLNRFGDDIYEAGYRVVTTLDSGLQTSAVNALRNGLLEYDRRHGYRGAMGQVRPDDGGEIDPESAEVQQALIDYPEYGGLRTAVVVAINAERNSADVVLRRGEVATIPWTGIAWAREYIDDNTRGAPIESVGDVLAPGDVVYVIPTVSDFYALAQKPQVEGAFVAIDPQDGAIVALHGGFDFSASKFNRATQIKRQPGSTFKPFIYSAALEHGMSAATVINDSPIVLQSEDLEGEWRPINYGGRFHGPTRLREALYRSFNLVSVRVLIRIGIGNAVRHLARFGFTGDQAPRNSSVALGSGAMSPLELALGYVVFASGGYRVDSYFIDTISDADGNVLHRADPAVVCGECEGLDQVEAAPVRELPGEPVYETADELIARAGDYRPDGTMAPDLFADMRLAPRVLDERNAYIISDMMRDVIRRGTGVRAWRALGRSDLSGKTGTSNDRRDAWFAGFNADLVAAAWVGFDQDRPLGGREEGSRTALPIWIHFMETALTSIPEHQLPQPPGLTTVRISPQTGKLARPGDPNFIFEIFRDENAPQPDYRDPGEIDLDPFNSGATEPDPTTDPLF